MIYKINLLKSLIKISINKLFSIIIVLIKWKLLKNKSMMLILIIKLKIIFMINFIKALMANLIILSNLIIMIYSLLH
jgi:hypothetical protein